MHCAVLLPLLLAPADLIVVNAKVWTDGKLHPGLDTLAVRGGRFIGIAKGRGAWTSRTIIDARGRVVIPGIIDSHTHIASSGTSLLELQLRPAKSKAHFIQLVREYSANQPKGAWIIGGGWSAESWPEKEQPTKEWIDAVTGGRPAILRRMDGHSALANSEALRRSGITRDTPNPPGGVIDKDPATGEPTGMLRETATGLVRRPAPSEDEVYRGLLAAVREANRHGVTAVSDISTVGRFAAVRRYAQSTNPTLRFAMYATPGADWSPTLKAIKNFKGVRMWAEPKGLKEYMDGSLGSRTAFMAEPFTKPLPGQKELRGVPMPGALDGTYARGVREAAEMGLQVIIHAIGDQANHDVLELYAQNVPKLASHRFRVEHVQHLLPADIARFGQLEVIPSMQPYHKADDGRYCEEVIGTERSRTSYTFSSLLRTGARLAFGSDWPVVTISPWEGIRAAVTGKIMTGRIWMPHENISFDQALTCYTSNAAYAMGWEKEIGRIAPGYRADFVILDRSPYQAGVDLSTIKPVAVYVEGRKAL